MGNEVESRKTGQKKTFHGNKGKLGGNEARTRQKTKEIEVGRPGGHIKGGQTARKNRGGEKGGVLILWNHILRGKGKSKGRKNLGERQVRGEVEKKDVRGLTGIIWGGRRKKTGKGEQGRMWEKREEDPRGQLGQKKTFGICIWGKRILRYPGNWKMILGKFRRTWEKGEKKKKRVQREYLEKVNYLKGKEMLKGVRTLCNATGTKKR